MAKPSPSGWRPACGAKLSLPPVRSIRPKAPAPDASFYARAAGPMYVNPVLTRALDAHDAAQAMRAIDALEATGGTTGLVSTGEGAPLVRALSYPDRSVRFRAAFAAARMIRPTQFAFVLPRGADSRRGGQFHRRADGDCDFVE